jgi:hypothetical protein
LPSKITNVQRKKEYSDVVEKPGRNAPCPCGSGRKYKHCCGSSNAPKIIPFPGVDPDAVADGNGGSAIIGPTADSGFFSDQGVKSDLSVLARDFVEHQNDTPQREFLGLSSSHMYNILNYRFDENTDIVSFHPRILWDDVESIPFLKQALYFLASIEEKQPVPATAQGNLPREFVKRIYENAVREHLTVEIAHPRKEDDVREIGRLRYVLTYAGLIRKYSKSFSLTRNASRMLEKRDWSAIYTAIFDAHSFEYLWENEDAYPELWLMQRSLIFNLYLLKKRAGSYISAGELANAYVMAFPNNVKEAMEYSNDPADLVARCFVTRFIERYAEPMGLISPNPRVDEQSPSWGIDVQYRTTAIFDRAFHWKA